MTLSAVGLFLIVLLFVGAEILGAEGIIALPWSASSPWSAGLSQPHQ
jgi:hypothetical protein